MDTDRAGLADFLRRRREAVQPSDVGLPPGVRRRTAGLRREEVAQLAGISADYCVRLEQGRGPHPSPSVLAALARALRLTDDERDHLHRLAGHAPPRRTGSATHVRPGLLHLLDALTDAPAMVVDDLGAPLVANAMGRALYGTPYGTRDWFLTPGARDRSPREDHAEQSRVRVADLRATHGRRRGDADVEELVGVLRQRSPQFRELWDRHEVGVRRGETKRVQHPVVGTLTLDCEVLLTPEHDQALVVLSARPGTPAAEQLALLRVVGTQELLGSGPSAPRSRAGVT